MQHSSFDDFEAYRSALGDVNIRLTLLRRDQPQWVHDSLMVGPVHLQHGVTGSPLIAEAAAESGGMFFFVPVAGRHTINGEPSDDRLVLVAPGGADFTIAVAGRHEWLVSFVPQGLLESFDADDRHRTRGSRIERPGKRSVARLRSLLAESFQTARIEPTVLSQPASVAAMQAQLLAACQSVVARERTELASGRPMISRSHIIQATKRLIESRDDVTVRVDDLAIAADVSVRTLRNAFLDYYGVPPHRYLTLRRLHAVRSALRNADPEDTTVTRIAAEFGFWQFGRFAGEYSRLFGELPRSTLRGNDSRRRGRLNTHSAGR